MSGRALLFLLSLFTVLFCSCDGDGPNPDECECTEGPCCDGCTFHGPETRCDDQPVSTTQACRSDECRADVVERGLYKHCSGVSPECPENVLREGIWEVVLECVSDQVCVMSEEEALCHSCSHGCDDGYCNEDHCSSGSCCEDGHPAASTVQCSDRVEATECRCTNGDCGADIECRNQYRFCTGWSSECTMNNLGWGGWSVTAWCLAEQVCLVGGGRGECRDCNLGCELGECRLRECTTGLCCDGTFFLPEGRECSVEVEYRCGGTECGADAQKRTGTKRCNGTDEACHGEIEYDLWTIQDYCSPNQVCVAPSISTMSYCQDCAHGCADGSCND